MTKISIIKSIQTRTYRKKYVNGSVNSEGKKFKNQSRGLFNTKKPSPTRETVPLKNALLFWPPGPGEADEGDR
jgi:hypothetical protein